MTSISANGADFALLKDQSYQRVLPSKTPAEMEYNTVATGPAGSRQVVEFLADNSTYTFANGKAIIRLQSKGILSFQNAMLEFSATCSATGSGAYFHNGIWNWINRVRVLNGSIVVFDQLYKNSMRSMQWSCCRTPETDSTFGDACWGVSSCINRIARASGYNYLIPLDINLLSSDEIPFDSLQNGLTIELYLENPQACVNYVTPSTGSSPTYSINNLRLRCDEVFYQEDLMNKIRSIGTILLPYTNYKLTQFTIPAGSNVNMVPIQLRVQGVKRFLFWFQNSSDINNSAVPDVKCCEFLKSGMLFYQLKIDQTYYPPQPVKAQFTSLNDVTGFQEAFFQTANGLARHEADNMIQQRQNNGETQWNIFRDFLINADMYNNNMFVGVIDLKTFLAHDEDLLTKFDTTPGNTTIQLNFTLSNSYPLVTTTLNVVAIHSSIGVLDQKGKFFMIE